MNKMLKSSTLVIIIVLISLRYGHAQVLSPSALSKLLDEPSIINITSRLSDKGFTPNLQFSTMKEYVSSWSYLEAAAGKGHVSANLEKRTDSLARNKIVFYLFNPYKFKEFMNAANDEGSQFSRIKIAAGKDYYSFRSSGWLLFTASRKTEAGEQYFEIVM